jgi:hypothetical protein
MERTNCARNLESTPAAKHRDSDVGRCQSAAINAFVGPAPDRPEFFVDLQILPRKLLKIVQQRCTSGPGRPRIKLNHNPPATGRRRSRRIDMTASYLPNEINRSPGLEETPYSGRDQRISELPIASLEDVQPVACAESKDHSPVCVHPLDGRHIDA